jgi:hypothetical protein
MGIRSWVARRERASMRLGSGGVMIDLRVSVEDAAALLDLKDRDELVRDLDSEGCRPAESGPRGGTVLLSDVAKFKLAQVMVGLGVAREKAARYAEAVLGPRFDSEDPNALAWLEDEAQELFCRIADDQLARIFVRFKDDLREVDVGAVKPILLPTTRCEINVSRVIRPIMYRARNLSRK